MDIQTNPTTEEVRRALVAIGTIVTGRALVGVAVGTSETAIKHYLGRVPVSWFQTSPKYGDALPGETKAPDSTYVYLKAGTALSADIWIW